ncbi:MAG: hypothetical protein ABI721_03230 [Candidatus Dojkabacteria bacterium]
MARTKTTSFSSLEESPLLSRKPGQSTINVNKFDQARFTEIVDDGPSTSPVKIIIYIVIVIVVGVGAALLLRSLITNNQPTTNTGTPPAANSSKVTIGTVTKADSTATSLAANEDYTDSGITKAGDPATTGVNTTVDTLDFSKYTTFARLEFGLTGNNGKLPTTNLTYSAAEKSLTVNIPELKSVSTDLQKQIDINNIIKNITFDSATKNFKITFVEDTKYRVVPNTTNLTIDFKTVKELAKPVTATTPPPVTPTPTPAIVPPTTTDPARPASPHFTNDFSQDKQYVVSSLTGDTISHNIYYFDDLNTSFEFSWGQKNSVGDNYVPNATAYYDTSAPSGKTYLIVEISNLSGEIMSANGVTGLSAGDIQNKTGANTTGANLVRIDLLSFTGGVAKYRFELKDKADFKLWTQKTVDNLTQVISINIED